MVSKKFQKELSASCIGCCKVCHMTSECDKEIRPFKRSFEEFEIDLEILREYENVLLYGRNWRAVFANENEKELAEIISPINLDE